MGLIRRLFGIAEKAEDALACPYCEHALGAEHDGAECRRKQSRRFFLGALGTTAAVAIVAPEAFRSVFIVPKTPFVPKNQLLTTQEITAQALAVLRNNVRITLAADRDFCRAFLCDGRKIGAVIHVKKPQRVMARYSDLCLDRRPEAGSVA
jgi:hypothetical protein